MIMALMVGVAMGVGVEVVEGGMVIVAVEEAMGVEICNQNQVVTMIMGEGHLHNIVVSFYFYVMVSPLYLFLFIYFINFFSNKLMGKNT